MKKSTFFLFILFSFQTNLILGQNPYIREGSIGRQKEQTDTLSRDALLFCPIESWIGERFIFLPQPKSLQRYGYQSFSSGKGKYGIAIRSSYRECVGRVGTIIEVNNGYSNRITIKMDDNGQIYTGEGSESIDGIAPLSDIDNARSKWLGKTLWYKRKDIATYNDATEGFGNIILKKYSPVKVVDVIAGWYNHQPIRFILEVPSGEEGFIDINLSGTNVPVILRDNMRFEDFFMSEDPRKIYRWPNSIWEAIEESKVFIGMTSDQAKLSWGEPQKINRTITGSIRNEQWVYKSESYLYFENDILTTIQN